MVPGWRSLERGRACVALSTNNRWTMMWDKLRKPSAASCRRLLGYDMVWAARWLLGCNVDDDESTIPR